jgi:hypothetical protein
MQKIDLRVDYPCPCRREARLLPIALTEALGCDRCPNVYVITAEGDQVEQVSGIPTARRRWQWTGKTWETVPSQHPWGRWIILVAAVILLGLFVWTLVHAVPGQWAILVCIIVVSVGPFWVDRFSRWFLRR